MKTRKYGLLLVLVIVPGLIIFLASGRVDSEKSPKPGAMRATVIENFDAGTINLTSYPGEDVEPAGWQLNSQITYQNSPYSLKLSGNTWKVQQIQAIPLDSGDVWQVAAYIATKAEIQGFGIMDAGNVLFYSFAGSEEVDVNKWVPVYQGCFAVQQWNNYQLPVADDWLSFFGYLPDITALVYVNDKDATSQGVVYFDQIVDITDDLPVAPKVTIAYTIGTTYKSKKNTNAVEVQFYGEVTDPDSDFHSFFWDFGDDGKSTEQNPVHNFLIGDDHPYTVLLRVSDATNMWGWASCKIDPSPGSTSFPITLNFVGDIMLARKYESSGGIIPTQGVEAIFEPTRPYLGDAADITVANLECSLTTYGQHHPTKPIYFKGSPANVAGLSYAGIDIVTLANNHIMDYLQPGMQQTQTVLKSKNILYSGAGATSYEAWLPVFYSKSGVSFAFLAASDRTGQYNNYQPYLNAGYNKPGFANLDEFHTKMQINQVKQVSDLVVMEWHSGTEYSFDPKLNAGKQSPFDGNFETEEDYSPLNDSPDKGDREIRHFAIDNGADLVICNHPHIMHAVELYHGKLIAHSLGNFVFDLDYPETFPTFILNAKADQTGFYEFTLTPVYIDDYIPKRAEGGLGLHILDYLAQRSKELDTYLLIDRAQVIAKVMMDTLNMNIFETGFNANLPLIAVSGGWETAPLLLDKAGSISSVNTIEPPGLCKYRIGRDEIWFGNMENEGSTLWNLNSTDETYCDTAAYEGGRSIQQKREAASSSNIVTNFEQRIICRSDTLKYSLCGYIKTLNAAGVTIEVQYFNERDDIIPLSTQNLGLQVSGNTPWTYYFRDLTIPTGTGFFDIRLNSNKPTSGTALSWFDNVSLIRWEMWEEPDASKKIPAPNDYYFLQIKSSQYAENIQVNYTQSAFDELHVGVENNEPATDFNFHLLQNFPNPFCPEAGATNITFSMEKPAMVKLSIFNMSGQLVNVLANSRFLSGQHQILWDGKNSRGLSLPDGIYFYQMEAENTKQAKKCFLIHR